MNDKYYEELINKIYKLIDNKKIQEAYEIIQEEMNQPYIPSKYFDVLQELQIAIKNLYSSQKELSKYQNMTKLEFLSHVYRDHHVNVDVLTLYLTKYMGAFDETDLSVFKQIFLDEKVKNNTKRFILGILKECELSFEFDILNSSTKQMNRVTNNSPTEPYEDPFYKSLFDEVSSIFIKEPSLNNVAYFVIQDIFDYYFLDNWTTDIKKLALNISKYILKSFGNEVDLSPDFESWIKVITQKDKKILH